MRMSRLLRCCEPWPDARTRATRARGGPTLDLHERRFLTPECPRQPPDNRSGGCKAEDARRACDTVEPASRAGAAPEARKGMARRTIFGFGLAVGAGLLGLGCSDDGETPRTAAGSAGQVG